MTIVCATHFTDSSAEALAVAAQLAQKTGQPLWLLNVVGAGAGPARDDAARDALEAQAAPLRKQGLEVSTALLHGKLERSMAELCDFVGARLALAGEPQHPMFPLFATAADRLSSLIDAPLLLVRSRKPFSAWASGTAFLKVLLAIDHSWKAEDARGWLTSLARFGALDVLAVHVWSPEDERHRRDGGTLEDLTTLLKAETSKALLCLPENVISRVLLDHAPGDVGRALLRLAEEERTDLIALGTHGPKGLLARLRSVSHEVLVNGRASVALVPTPARVATSVPRPPRAGVALKETRTRSPWG